MAAPRTGVCEAWATTADLCSPCDDYTVDATLADDMLMAASNLLFQLTGRRWSGSCTATVRPCRQGLVDGLSADDRRWLETAGVVWWPSCRCNAGQRCGCSRLSEIDLGNLPVTDVTQVLIDGAAVTDFRVDDFRYLVRTGTTGWPCCQNLRLPSTETDTFEVSYTYGLEPPVEAVNAAAVLACELIKACQPEVVGQCRLPRRVQTLARQGVTEELLVIDTVELFRNGLTGIEEIDLVIAAHNPAGIRRPAVVLTPDVGKRARRAGT